jgi:NADH:quinone reductase (non-electrogenic)
MPHRVVIIGGGFAGLNTARRLARSPVDVTLVDRRNFHLFQPLLYQVATGGLSPANISAPLRAVLKRQANTRVVMAEVTGFDTAGRRVRLADGDLPYDTLVVASGSQHHYFGHDEWEELAPGLKTVEDATRIRARVLGAFEAAERETDPEQRRTLLAFVIIGGGPTGVELAGAVAELARHTLPGDFRNFDPAAATVLLLEGGDRILPAYPPDLSAHAVTSLRGLGVAVRTGAKVTGLEPGAVTVAGPDGGERIRAGTILWAAGVGPSPLGRMLGKATGAPLDRSGRPIVQPDLSLPGHPEIFLVGDLAHCVHRGGNPLPGVAQVAIQQGRYAGAAIDRRLRGRPSPPFRYHDPGSLATIGRAAAVADFGRLRLHGYPAWVVWLFVHLMSLVQFENRLLVFVQWCWNYITRNRAARLITRPPAA